MTKDKAIEILDKEYDFFLNYREYPYVDIDTVNDILIALVTAIDAMESAT